MNLKFNLRCFYCVLLIFLICVLVLEFLMPIRDNNDQIQLDIKENYESYLRLISSNVLLHYETADLKMEDLIINPNSKVNSMRLSDFLSDDSYLVLRYNETFCSSCVDHTLEALLKYKEEIGLENIIIMATSENNRKLKALINRKDKIDVIIINLISEIKLPIERYGIPYFFVINKDLELNMLFIPIKEFPENTYRYLYAVSERFNYNSI